MPSERQHAWYMRDCVFFIPAERKSYQPNVRLVSAWRGGCKVRNRICGQPGPQLFLLRVW